MTGRRGARARRALVVAEVAVLLAGVVRAQPPPAPPVDELVVALQRKYDSVRTLSAEFEHTYTGGVLRTSLVERGTVQIKKPGKMRWNYVSPEEKLFVSDGESLYSYIPFDQQVIVGSVPQDDDASTPTLFLAGKGDLSTDFTARYAEAPTASPNTWTLELIPKTANVDYTQLTLVVDRDTLSIIELRSVDFQGASSIFSFAQLHENPALPDSLFRFDIPRGTEVITEGSFGR